MARLLDPTSLVPAGFVVDDVLTEGDCLIVSAHSAAKFSHCPSCGRPSARVHSRYRRRLSDLPSAGRRIHLDIVARKFRCTSTGCKRRVFAERFAEGTIRRSARRTDRLDLIVHHLGIALGGRPAASFAKRLMLPVSNDTL